VIASPEENKIFKFVLRLLRPPSGTAPLTLWPWSWTFTV